MRIVDFGEIALHAAAAEVVAEALDARLAGVFDRLDEIRHLLFLARLVQHDVVDVLGVEVLDALEHEPVLLRLGDDPRKVLLVPVPVARAKRHPCHNRLAPQLPRHRQMRVVPLLRMHCQTKFHFQSPCLTVLQISVQLRRPIRVRPESPEPTLPQRSTERTVNVEEAFCGSYDVATVEAIWRPFA